MSSIFRRLIVPLIRPVNPDVTKNGIDSRISLYCRYGSRLLSTESGQGDDTGDEGKVIKKKLEKAVKRISDKVGGQEGELMKESLMKMVSLQSEESKKPTVNVMKNISDILKDIPIEVSKKMTNKMDKKRERKISEKIEEGETHGWIERPPRLDFYQRRPSNDQRRSFDDQKRYSENYRRNNYSPGVQGFDSRLPLDRVNYKQAKPLNLFETALVDGDYHQLKVWNRLRQEEMDLAFRRPPRNAFDEMIQLTREGKLWSFPIDNEAGMDEEAKVPFYEHTLLEHLLEDLPPSGPVREFMDVVTIGVSNNPYITVERKHAVIGWFVEYFKEKESILRECGAL